MGLSSPAEGGQGARGFVLAVSLFTEKGRRVFCNSFEQLLGILASPSAHAWCWRGPREDPRPPALAWGLPAGAGGRGRARRGPAQRSGRPRSAGSIPPLPQLITGAPGSAGGPLSGHSRRRTAPQPLGMGCAPAPLPRAECRGFNAPRGGAGRRVSAEASEGMRPLGWALLSRDGALGRGRRGWMALHVRGAQTGGL